MAENAIAFYPRLFYLPGLWFWQSLGALVFRPLFRVRTQRRVPGGPDLHIIKLVQSRSTLQKPVIRM